MFAITKRLDISSDSFWINRYQLKLDVVLNININYSSVRDLSGNILNMARNF